METLSTLMKSSPVCRAIQINGKQHYLWRAVDQDGEVVDVYLQASIAKSWRLTQKDRDR